MAIKITKKDLGMLGDRLKLKKTPKFNNVRLVIDGITFHSKGEAMRYLDLLKLEREGKIANLDLQPRFKLFVKDVFICTYIADFRYTMDGKDIVEDFKGVETAVFRLKAKMFKASFPELKLLITRKKDLISAKRDRAKTET